MGIEIDYPLEPLVQGILYFVTPAQKGTVPWYHSSLEFL